MNNRLEVYFNMQSRLFPIVEEKIGELTKKQQEFLRIIELVKSSRFMTGVLSWCGLGRRLKRDKAVMPNCDEGDSKSLWLNNGWLDNHLVQTVTNLIFLIQCFCAWVGFVII